MSSTQTVPQMPWRTAEICSQIIGHVRFISLIDSVRDDILLAAYHLKHGTKVEESKKVFIRQIWSYFYLNKRIRSSRTQSQIERF